MLALKETHYRFVMSDSKACEYNNALLIHKISCLLEDEPDNNILHFFLLA